MESSTSTNFQLTKPYQPASKIVGNSFKKFTDTLQNSKGFDPINKKRNAPHFVPLPLPIPKKNPIIRQTVVNNKTSEPGKNLATNQENVTANVIKKPEYKTQDLIKSMKVATGNVESTLKWFKKFTNQLMLYEVYANVLTIRPGNHLTEKVLLLRNSTGPILQAVFYEIDTKLPNVRNGDLVKCIGRNLNNSRLHILKIKPITAKEMENAARLMAISNFILNT